jgi:hypothetical protein
MVFVLSVLKKKVLGIFPMALPSSLRKSIVKYNEENM